MGANRQAPARPPPAIRWAVDRQGLKQFTTPQHRQLHFGSLLDDLVSDYRVRRVKSLGSALSHIKPLRDHFGDWRALDINFRAIEGYITKRREEGKANATINRELELLRRALRLAYDPWDALMPALLAGSTPSAIRRRCTDRRGDSTSEKDRRLGRKAA